MTFSDINLQLLNRYHQLLISELRKRGFEEAEVLKLSATFFLSWQKSFSENSKATGEKYLEAVNTFLSKLDSANRKSLIPEG